LLPPSSAAAPRLRLFLTDAGFIGDGVARLLHAGDERPSAAAELAVHLRRLDTEPGALATLVRLFVLSNSVDVDVAERHLAPVGLDAFVQASVVAAPGIVTPLVKLVPLDELVIASDLGGGDRADHVAGIDRPSATLSHLTVRRPVARALEVGTGNGIQALLLAAHAEHVVADRPERTGPCVRRVQCRAERRRERRGARRQLPRAGRGGALRGRRGKPPYVISPESEFLFRDSGLERDRAALR
jgi:hypothetical protein